METFVTVPADLFFDLYHFLGEAHHKRFMTNEAGGLLHRLVKHMPAPKDCNQQEQKEGV